MAAKMEKAHGKTIAEVGRVSAKAEEALRTTNETLEMVKNLAGRLLRQWESSVVILEAIVAAVMLSLGLVLLIRP
jgi:hypothetical protein